MNYEQKLERAKRRMLASFEILPNGCWEMTKNIGAANYSQVMVDGEVFYVYRFLYEWLVGPIPHGYDLDHECHNEAAERGECEGGNCRHRRCVNPEHMTPKPHGQNLLDSPLTQAAINKAKTHCKRGHEFTEANTGYKKDSRWRYCRACNKMTKAERDAWDVEHA